MFMLFFQFKFINDFCLLLHFYTVKILLYMIYLHIAQLSMGVSKFLKFSVRDVHFAFKKFKESHKILNKILIFRSQEHI